MSERRTPIKLTKAEVEGLRLEAGSYFCPVVNARGQAIQGLNVRVMPSGMKSFVHRYRHQGIQKVLTLGRFPAMTPDAAEKASLAAQVRINGGEDPNQSKVDARKSAALERKAAFTVADLAERYIEEHITPNNHPSWASEATRLIKKHILPALGKLPLVEVGPADISGLLFKMRKATATKKATPTQANRTRAVLRTMFGRAEEWELRPLGSNPVAVVKLRAPEKKRERRLSDMELKPLGLALRASKEAPEYLLAVRLALLAGMRKGEIQALRWEWLNLEAGEIRIPPESHKAGRKTGRVRIVHLCSELVAEFKCLCPILGCSWVVPGLPVKDEDGKIIRHRPCVSLQNPWERIRVAAGLAVDGKPLDEDPGWHDLRRTFASVGADLGLKGFVGELLGHAEASVTDIYTRTAATRLKEAAEAIGARVQGLLSGAIDPAKEAEERKREAAPRAVEGA
jgi:integrase